MNNQKPEKSDIPDSITVKNKDQTTSPGSLMLITRPAESLFLI